MQITRNSLETAAGPSDWFTGAVYIDTIAAPVATARAGAAPTSSTTPHRLHSLRAYGLVAGSLSSGAWV